MKERGIIFSTELISKVLDGTKTQTRRVIKPQPQLTITEAQYKVNIAKCPELCPYGQVGDRLWVRETWAVHRVNDNRIPSYIYPTKEVWYKTTSLGGRTVYSDQRADGAGKWRSPRFMPRWASRVLLEITEVRAERLQDITEEDAKAEGVTALYRTAPNTFGAGYIWDNKGYRRAFQDIWVSLNPRYPWAGNNWVWPISFKEVK